MRNNQEKEFAQVSNKDLKAPKKVKLKSQNERKKVKK